MEYLQIYFIVLLLSNLKWEIIFSEQLSLFFFMEDNQYLIKHNL